MKCPSCGSESSGKFCAQCGAPLADAQCVKCAAPLEPGARFCTGCGAPARSAIGGNTGWFVAAGVLIVMIGLVWILTSRDRSAGDAAITAGNAAAPVAAGQGAAQSGAGAQPGSTVDPSLGTPPELTGTPREQADRLFNRIMTERESGDTAKARFFLPMGIMAYEQAGELEADGLYHLAILQSSAGRPQDAMKTSQRILATQPDHLLALGAAAEAAEEAGMGPEAAKYYAQLYRVYDTEKKKTLAEYIDHAKVIPQYYDAARRFLKK